MVLGVDKMHHWLAFGHSSTLRRKYQMIIQRKDITSVLPNGILEHGEFTPDCAGLAVHMRGFYTVGELKAIIEDLIHVDSKYQAQQMMNEQS